MEEFDDLDPQAPQQDSSRAIIALLVIMGLVLLWSTVMGPMLNPPQQHQPPEGAKATTAAPARGTEPGKAPELTTAAPTKATTAVPPKAKDEPVATKKPEPPPPKPEPEPAAAPAEVTKRSALLSASFTNQDARLARLVLLDHFRTPPARRAALRARRGDPDADLSPWGLPLLGQEEPSGLENGGFELGEDLLGASETAPGPPALPRFWVAAPREDIGRALLWSQEARTGKRSLAIKDPAREVLWRTLLKGVKSAATYELVCWVRLDCPDALPEAAQPFLRLTQLDSDGKHVEWRGKEGEAHKAELTLRVPNGAGWQRLEARFLTEERTRQVQLVFQAPQAFKGQAWLDDLSLVRLGVPSLVLMDPRPIGEKMTEAEAELVLRPRYDLVSQTTNQVTFRTVVPSLNLEVTKTFSLPGPGDPLQRHVALELQFRNLGDQELKLSGYLLRGPGGLAADLSPASWKHGETVPTAEERKAASASLVAAVAREASGGQINVPTKSLAEIIALEKGTDKDKGTTWREVGGVLWAAVASNYFVSIIEPRPGESGRMKVESGGARAVGEDNLDAVIQVAPFSLDPRGGKDAAVVHRFRLFAGPKAPDVLASYGAKYEKLIASRWLDPLTAGCAWVLRASYFLIPNYGIAIIVLTIIVRIILHPLSKKSQTSMQKMQKLQPQVAEIREKYKADKKRQQEEMMALYRKYGVNPMGGCLPIVLQIPVFIGLWRALQESIELRQAPFCLWIQDLSQPDALFGVVNVLPIASCVFMFVQQRLTPKTGDPQQQQTAKMMGYIMPVFLAWILYSLPSGLGLYFIASTIVGLGEQKVIKMHMDRVGELKPIAERPTKQTRKAIFSRGDKRPKKKFF